MKMAVELIPRYDGRLLVADRGRAVFSVKKND